MGDDADPADPRPDGHYHVDRNAKWYYVDDGLAGTIALGPATDGDPVTTGCLRSRLRRQMAIPSRPSVSPFTSRRGRSTSSTSRHGISHQTLVRQATPPSVGSVLSVPWVPCMDLTPSELIFAEGLNGANSSGCGISRDQIGQLKEGHVIAGRSGVFEIGSVSGAAEQDIHRLSVCGFL